MARMFALALFVVLPAFAQPSMEIYSGLNWPRSPFGGITDIYLSDYWALGIDVGLSADFQLANWIIISPGFEHDRYPFGHYYEGVSTGEQSVQASSGKNANIYRFPVLLRLIDNSSEKMKPYLSIGGEYVLEDIGRIIVDWRQLDGATFQSEIQFPGKKYWSYIIGFGIAFRVWPQIDVDPSFKYCSNDTDRSCFAINLGFKYHFGE